MSSRFDPDHNIVSHFSAFLKRQGFCKPHVKRVGEGLFPGLRYAISFFDEFEGRERCLSLTSYDMKCVMHANDIFWRYMK